MIEIKRSKIRRNAVEVRPSRIRRQPVVAAPKPPEPRTEEQELIGGVAGIILFAILVAVAIIGISIATITHQDPRAAAHAAQFGQCYNSGVDECVLDGDTIYVGGQRVDVAGIVAPAIQGAKCSDERTRGIESALKLADLLNSGKVTLGDTVRDSDGTLRRRVAVDGKDVAAAMIDAGVTQDRGSGQPDWCS